MPTVMINGKKHTPSSGTLKKMKAAAAAKASTPAKTPAKKPMAMSVNPAKAPIPATRSAKPSVNSVTAGKGGKNNPFSGVAADPKAKVASGYNPTRPALPGALNPKKMKK